MNLRPFGQMWIACVAAGVLLWSVDGACGQDAAAVQKLLDDAQPGKVIEVRSATYVLDQPWVLSKSGTADQPIIIRALTTGGAILTGKAGFHLNGASHVLIQGFEFRHDDAQPAVRLIDCNRVRITRNLFRLNDRVAPRQNWIHITGGKSGQNRIDHNLFEQKATPGAFIAIDGSEEKPFKMSEGDRIDHNHFRAIGPDDDNRPPLAGVRAIRLGWSEATESDAKSVVEYNLFEKCRGDNELISVRSSGQFIRYNTFINCVGYVALRSGSKNHVEGNFFFGENRKSIGAVQVNGQGHKIYNNYFEGMSLPALEFTNGANGENSTGPGVVARLAAKDVDLVFNTFVNCLGGTLHIGVDGPAGKQGMWTVAPTGLTIANNIVIGYGEDLVAMKTKDAEVTWLANIMFHAGDKEKVGIELEDTQIRVVFPKLRRAGGIWRINHNSPAVDIAEGDFDYVTTDIDGQPRPKGKDIGADEFGQTPVKLKPLTDEDVGIAADAGE